MKEEKDTNLVELTSVQGEIEEKMVVSILESEGIKVLVKSGRAGGTLPFTADGMGKVRLYVREDEYEEAMRIIENFNSE